MGDSLRWCGEHTLIYREERPVEWGVQPITWGNQQNWAPYGGGGGGELTPPYLPVHPPPSHYGKACILDMLRNFSNNHVWYFWF